MSTTNYLIGCGDSGLSSTNAGSTAFRCPYGYQGNAAEVATQGKVRDTYTWKLLGCNVYGNNNPATCYVKSRKNSGAGSQSVAITGSTTGIFQDIVNTDALANGDHITYQIVSTAGSGLIRVPYIWSILSNATNTYGYIGAGVTPEGYLANGDYFNIGGIVYSTNAAVYFNMKFETATTLAKMVLYAGSSASIKTPRLYKNSVAGNEIVSVPASTAGEYEDVVNTDTIAAGDVVCCKVDGAGVLVFNTMQFRTTSAVSYCLQESDGNSYNNVTFYQELFGQWSSVAGVTEGNAQFTPNIALTAKNFHVSVGSNNHNVADTITTRKDSGNGNITVTITASTTGVFEDTTHTDSLVTSSKYCIQAKINNGTGTMSMLFVGIELYDSVSAPAAPTTFLHMGKYSNRMRRGSIFSPTMNLGV